jgi:hypothetical protein
MTAVAKATTVRPMPLLIKTVNTLHDKAVEADDRSVQAGGKAKQLWTALGIELQEAKARYKEAGDLTWPQFARNHFSFRQSRADQLIRIADGRTSVDEVRANGAARAQKARDNSALRNADLGGVSFHGLYSRPDGLPSKKALDLCQRPQEFVADFKRRFRVWLRANPAPSEPDKEALLASVQSCADEMSRLAQHLRPDGAPP